MAKSSGTYVLYRKLGGFLKKLSLIKNAQKEDSFIVEFGSKNQSDDLLLKFSNSFGTQAKFLITGKAYYPSIKINNTSYYLYEKNSNQFELKKSQSFQNRIFLYLPKGDIYTSKTNLNGYFYVHGTCLEKSSIAEFNKYLTDQIYLRDLSGNKIIAQDCLPNCHKKHCNSDDGCGMICECKKKESEDLDSSGLMSVSKYLNKPAIWIGLGIILFFILYLGFVWYLVNKKPPVIKIYQVSPPNLTRNLRNAEDKKESKNFESSFQPELISSTINQSPVSSPNFSTNFDFPKPKFSKPYPPRIYQAPAI